jgi:hypothetical protein
MTTRNVFMKSLGDPELEIPHAREAQSVAAVASDSSSPAAQKDEINRDSVSQFLGASNSSASSSEGVDHGAAI